jgi:hypothetical protein
MGEMKILLKFLTMWFIFCSRTPFCHVLLFCLFSQTQHQIIKTFVQKVRRNTIAIANDFNRLDLVILSLIFQKRELKSFPQNLVREDDVRKECLQFQIFIHKLETVIQKRSCVVKVLFQSCKFTTLHWNEGESTYR